VNVQWMQPLFASSAYTVPVLAANEDASAGHGWLRPRRRRVGKSDRPLECELRHLRGGQPGLVGALKAGIGERRRTMSSMTATLGET
jgi:hypothetical protein